MASSRNDELDFDAPPEMTRWERKRASVLKGRVKQTSVRDRDFKLQGLKKREFKKVPRGERMEVMESRARAARTGLRLRGTKSLPTKFPLARKQAVAREGGFVRAPKHKFAWEVNTDHRLFNAVGRFNRTSAASSAAAPVLPDISVALLDKWFASGHKGVNKKAYNKMRKLMLARELAPTECTTLTTRQGHELKVARRKMRQEARSRRQNAHDLGRKGQEALDAVKNRQPDECHCGCKFAGLSIPASEVKKTAANKYRAQCKHCTCMVEVLKGVIRHPIYPAPKADQDLDGMGLLGMTTAATPDVVASAPVVKVVEAAAASAAAKPAPPPRIVSAHHDGGVRVLINNPPPSGPDRIILSLENNAGIPNDKATKVAALMPALDGYHISQSEAESVLEGVAQPGTVTIELAKYKYQCEKRLVCNRGVSETTQDFLVQEISYITTPARRPNVVRSGLAQLAVLTICGFLISWWFALSVPLWSGGLTAFLVHSKFLSSYFVSQYRFRPDWRWDLLWLPVLCVANTRNGPACVAWSILGLLLVYEKPRFVRVKRFVVPHLLSTALLDSSVTDNATTTKSNIRAACLRAATLPLPDVMAHTAVEDTVLFATYHALNYSGEETPC